MMRFLYTAAVLLFVQGTSVAAAPAHIAGDNCGCPPTVDTTGAAATVSRSGPWWIAETANFQVCCLRGSQQAVETARACERLRACLCRQWLGDQVQPWPVRCQIVLHTSLEGYLRAVPGGHATRASAAWKINAEGAIVSRRIDVRAGSPQVAEWFDGGMPHEMTHLVLADRFAPFNLPLWADEGLATLADPWDKQQLHLADVVTARMRQTHFRLAELLTAADHCPLDRRAAFYGQSLSLVRFLLKRGNGADLLAFLASARSDGYDRALEAHYGIAGLGECERLWSAEAELESPVAAEFDSVRVPRFDELATDDPAATPRRTLATPVSWLTGASR